MGLVVNECGKDRALRLQMLVVDSCSQTYKIRDASWVGKVIDIGIQFVPLKVVSKRCTPVG